MTKDEELRILEERFDHIRGLTNFTYSQLLNTTICSNTKQATGIYIDLLKPVHIEETADIVAEIVAIHKKYEALYRNKIVPLYRETEEKLKELQSHKSEAVYDTIPKQ